MEDFGTIISNSLTSIFTSIFSSLDNSFYYILDNLAFINTTILDNAMLTKILNTNKTSGILAICNSLILAFVLYYSIRYLFSHLIYSKTESPKEFIVKAIVFGALMNNSIWFCEQLIYIVDFCSSFLIYTAEQFSNLTISFSEFIKLLNSSLFWTDSANNLFSFSGIVKSFASIGLVNLVFSFSLRYIMVLVLIMFSPFAFLCLLNTTTSWIFKSWIKTFISLLLYQLLIAFILIISFSFGSLATTLLSSVFYVGTIQALERSGHFIKEMIGGISISANTFSNFKTN